MSHVPHALSEEFPGQQEQIRKLIVEDPNFAQLAEFYAMVNVRIHEAETYEKPMEELAEHQLRKRRMFLKDQISRYLSRAA